MNFVSLKDFLIKIQEDLKKNDKVREKIQKDMRKATRLSKQAIQVTHQERYNDAIAFLNEAKDIFSRLRETSEKYPNIFYSGYVGAAFEEHAEAYILLTLIKEDRFIGPKEIDVPIVPYLLSLGDVIGELRRRVLDLIRRGDLKASEKYLETMENIYSELTALDDAYVIVNGLRRKCDVARKLIEITRGDITNEVRRNALENSILKLEKKMEYKE